MMVDVEQPQPALLAHRQRDEAAELDQLGLGEVGVQPLPERVIGVEPPGNRLCISQRCLLPLAEAG